MAVLPAMSALDLHPLGGSDNEDETAAPGAPAPGSPAGPDLLAAAAEVLPLVASVGLVLLVDLHTALYEAACVIGIGANRPHRLLLADEAFDLLVDYLAVAGQVQPAVRSGHAMREWLRGREPAEVAYALRAAGAHWRWELGARSDPPPRGPDG